MKHPAITAGLIALLATAPALAERYKLAPSAQDAQQMEARLTNGEAFALDAFLAKPESYHWTAFYQAAQHLFEAGRRDEALMWFYAGQIRGRVAAGLDPDPSRNNAMLSAFNASLGQPIMEYAQADAQTWGERIDAALAWDKAHPLPADSRQVIGVSDVAWDPANFQTVYAAVRSGLQEMRATLE